MWVRTHGVVGTTFDVEPFEPTSKIVFGVLGRPLFRRRRRVQAVHVRDEVAPFAPSVRVALYDEVLDEFELGVGDRRSKEAREGFGTA